CANEIAPELSSASGGPAAGHRPARALRGSGFLNAGIRRMSILTLTSILSRFAVEGAIEAVGWFGDSRERDSAAWNRPQSPRAREARGGRGEGLFDGT